jgi:hypothetical protein
MQRSLRRIEGSAASRVRARPVAHHAARRFAAFALVVLAALSGCVGSGSGASSGGSNDEIDCSGLTCDWTTVQGNPVFGTTWHDGDLGVDLSAPGKQVIELKDVFFVTHNDRQLTLRAVITRHPSASISFQLDFYGAGQGTGPTFWDRGPTFLVTRQLDVVQQGVFQFARPVLVPSEGAAVILRIVKDGGGPAMVDELTLGP